jgi:hypothetical protein
MYFPTHALAEEQARKLRAARPELTVKVVGGRSHLAADGQPLCRKYQLAADVAAAGGDVSSALCGARKDKPEERCEYYESCPYIAQFIKPSQVTFYPHAYLALERMRLEGPPAKIAVIDESFFLSCIRNDAVPRSLLRADFVGPLAQRVLGEIEVALLHNLPLLRHLTLREIFHAEIRAAVKELRDGQPAISPTMPEAEQRAALRLLRQQTQLVSLLKAVHSELFTRRSGSHALKYRPGKDIIDVRTKARIHRFSHRPRQGESYDSRVLIIDASADEAILSEFFEISTFVEIQVQRQAEVIQCSSTRCSTTSIMPEKNGDPEDRQRAQERLRDIERLLYELAARHSRLLVVGPQAITGNPRTGLPPAITVPGNVELAHFNAVRGLDGWKDCDAIVVVGRNQPTCEEIEGIARAVFHTNDAPLQFAEDWTTQERGYRMRDHREKRGVDVVTHSDNRVQAILEQLREHESQQAIDRLRLVHAERPKRVYLLSNLPLDIEVDRLVTWDEMMEGGSRVEQAWNQLSGVMPMAPVWLATKFPALWKSPDAAKADARAWRKKGRFTNIFSIGNPTLFRHEYRPATSKQRQWSWCLSDTADAEATRRRLYALLGEVEMRPAEKTGEPPKALRRRPRRRQLPARRTKHKAPRTKPGALSTSPGPRAA